MMHRMGTIASQEYPDSGAPLEEGGVRAAILAATRKVAERDGVLEMTLTGVAREASVAAADIYVFFTSKNDLLQAVVADDLANLAKTMRRSLEHQTDGENAAAAANAIAIPLQRVDQPEETQVSPMQATETSRTEKPNTTEPAASAPVQETPRRFPVVQARREPMRSTAPEADAATAEAVARLQESVAKLESRPVDQWLERRLREFERALESLQNNRSERSTSNNSVEERLQRLRESVEAVDMRHAMAADETARAVGERFDGADRRLRETLSDLQAEAVHLARRITALENLAFASRPEAMPPPATFEPVSEAAPPPMLVQLHEE